VPADDGAGRSTPEMYARDIGLFPVGWGSRILRKAAGQLADLVLKDFGQESVLLHVRKALSVEATPSRGL